MRGESRRGEWRAQREQRSTAEPRIGDRSVGDAMRTRRIEQAQRPSNEARNWNDIGRNGWRPDRDRDGDRGNWNRERDRTDWNRDRDRDRRPDWNNGRRWDNDNRRWNDNNRRWDNDRRDWDGRRWDGRDRWADQRRWDRDWRRDNRYDWQRYRSYNRGIYRMPRYYAPYGWNSGYRSFSIGIRLNSLLYGQNYWISDPGYYRLPAAYGYLRWVRYYDDALLVDIRDGYVVDVIRNFFW